MFWMQAQTSHAVGSVVQRLEKEIEVAAAGVTATSERVAQVAVAETRSDLQAQIEQTRAESQRRDAEQKLRMDEIAANLATLTDQLNRFKPASVADVSGSQEKLSIAVETKLDSHSVRLDALSDMATEAQKAAVDNADILQNLLVGMENLGDSVRKLGEKVHAWGEPGNDGWGYPNDQEILDEIRDNFPEVTSPSEQPQGKDQTPSANLQIPPVTQPILSNPMSESDIETDGPNLLDMQKKLTALKTGPPAIKVSKSGEQGDAHFGKYYTPASMTLPYPVLDGHPRRITPIPVTVTMRPPAVNVKDTDQIAQEKDALIKRLENEKKQQEKLVTKLARQKKEFEERKAITRGDFSSFSGVGQQAAQEDTMELSDQSSGTNRSTIGQTFIPPDVKSKFMMKSQLLCARFFLESS